MIISAQATADFTTRGPTPLNSPRTPSSYASLLPSDPTRNTLAMMPKEGSAFPERTCCCVFTTSNGFTRNEASAPAVAPHRKLFAGRGRSVFLTTARVCSKLHDRRQTSLHQPVQRGEGDVAQQVGVDPLPQVGDSVDRRLVSHATNGSHEASGHPECQSTASTPSLGPASSGTRGAPHTPPRECGSDLPRSQEPSTKN